MLINRDELARKVLEGEITNLDDLNSVLRSMIKDVVETAMGAEMTSFLGYDRYRTPDSDPGNRRNGYSQKELASKIGPIVIDVPRDRKSEFGRTQHQTQRGAASPNSTKGSLTDCHLKHAGTIYTTLADVTLREVRDLVEDWLKQDNEQRPHESLGDITPSEYLAINSPEDSPFDWH